MRTKTFLISALLLFSALSIRAGIEDAKTLCIENVNGEVFEVALIENPKLTFRSQYVVIQASTAKIFKFKDLQKAYFTEEETGIDPVTKEEKIQSKANTVTLRNFQPGTKVRVYTPAGMIVKQSIVTADGTLNIPLSELPRGTYIIKANKTAFKMINL